MPKRYLIVLILFFLFFSNFCLAQQKILEVRYPEILGLRPETIKTELGDYIKYVFYFVLMASGLIAFGSLIYAGVLYLMSGVKPGLMQEAKSRILYSLVGLVLVFGAYLISNTINPQLVVPSIEIYAVEGVTLYDKENCCEGGGECESRDVMGNVPDLGFGAKSLKFIAKPRELRARVYNMKSYGVGQAGARALDFTSDVQTCRNFEDYESGFSGWSIKLFWELPGAYLCTDILREEEGILKCKAPGVEEYFPAGARIPYLMPDVDNKARGIRFKNAETFLGTAYSADHRDKLKNICEETFRGEFYEGDGHKCYCITSKYGAVLFYLPDFEGPSRIILENLRDLNETGTLYPQRPVRQDMTSSVMVFTQGKASGETIAGKTVTNWSIKKWVTEGTPEVIGDERGVVLCIKPEPELARGAFEIVKENGEKGEPFAGPCYGPYVFAKVEDIDNIKGGKGIPNDSIRSIFIKPANEYLAVLFDGGNGDAFIGNTTQAFTASNGNLDGEPIGKCKRGTLPWELEPCTSSFIVLPIEK